MAKKIENDTEFKSNKEELALLIEEDAIKSKQLRNYHQDIEATSVGLDLTDARLFIINKAIAGDFLPDSLFEELGDFKTMEELIEMKREKEKMLSLLNERYRVLSAGTHKLNKELRQIKSRIKMLKLLLLKYRVQKIVNVVRIRSLKQT